MKKLQTSYLGLKLKSPIVAAASPLTDSLARIEALEAHGVGAVVLKSIFEEQLEGHAAMLARLSDYPEAADYLNRYAGSEYFEGHLELIAAAKKHCKIPIIASLNCAHAGSWGDYAQRIEQAGADAIELNIFLLPTSAAETSEQIEARYLQIVAGVVERVRIPVAVKLTDRLTNIVAMSAQLYNRKARGVVLYNRFFEPDIDLQTLALTASEPLSTPSELRGALRQVGLCHSALPELDIAVSTGVHTGADALKALLAGASAVQVCSTIYKNGLEVIGRMNASIEEWMAARDFNAIEQFRGMMDYKGAHDAQLYQRVQYMRFFPHE